MPKKDELPGFYTKRKILFGSKTSKQKLRETGSRFMERERYDDALEFFQRCGADDLTRQVASAAVEAGNTPLYLRAKRVLGEPPEEDDLSRLALAAEQAGIYSAAWLAHHKAGHEQEAQRLRQRMPGAAPPAGEDELQDGAEGA
ncbi:MAG: hypothetical protein J7M08_10085 [Planctomycetes bacterium]|nr:hypothetical protein [Planctomycetota bacterium]